MRQLPPPRRLQHVDSDVLKVVERKVNGQWGRVTADESGAVTIHNQPQVDAFDVQELRPTRAAVRATRGRRPPKTKADVPSPTMLRGTRRRADVELVELRLPPRVPSRPRDTDAPDAPAEPRFQRATFSWIKIPGLTGEGDWERVGLGKTAHALSRQLQRGLPAEAPLSFHSDVLALNGVDIPAAEAVVRHPEQVRIAKETKEKKHPILTFHRGDVTVVVGFRNPHDPKVIAAYFTGEALKAYERSRDLTGGGGSRRDEGVPKHPAALVSRLRAMGATVTDDRNGSTALVNFHGQDLGRITIGNVGRGLTERDWQRTQRQIYAIKRREQTSRAG